jgi:hypothetical protein
VLGAEEDGGLRVVEEASRRRRVGEGNRRGGELESRIHGRRLDEPMANPWAVGWVGSTFTSGTGWFGFD